HEREEEQEIFGPEIRHRATMGDDRLRSTLSPVVPAPGVASGWSGRRRPLECRSMAAKRPLVDLPWHVPSDQPDRIRDPAIKRALRRSGWGEYLRTAAMSAMTAPVVAARLPGVLAGF